MEKIVLPFNSSVYNTTALDFAAYLGRLTGSAVTGIFLEDLGKLIGAEAITAQKKEAEKNIRFFREGCESRSVRYAVKRDAGTPVTEVTRESRYADVVVMDAATSFADSPEGTPTVFVKQVLSASECPVIIAPRHFDEISEIIFLFNGSRSSVFAARQFSYLFPQLDDRKVSIVEIGNGHTVAEREKAGMRNWMREHYSSIGYTTIQGDPVSTMFTLLSGKKNAFVVMGAYGRNALSRFLHKSTAELLIKTMSHAFFIAHH